MVEAISREACIKRHVEYKYDTQQTTVRNSDQIARLTWMTKRIPSGCKVLDIGCNSGIMATLVKADWYGVDVCPQLVEIAKQIMKAEVAPAEKLPFRDNEFDIAVLGEILEHVFSPDDVMAEAVRVTKKLIIGSTPNERGQWGTSATGSRSLKKHHQHVRCYTEETLNQLLKKYSDKFVIENCGIHKKRWNFYCFCLEV